MSIEQERAEFRALVESLSGVEQERADFEAWLRVKPCGAAHDFAWEAWQARAALQSQDREDVAVLKVALEEAAQTMRAVLAQERLKAVAKRCLSRAVGVCDRAIDHARRVEGES